MGDHERGRSEMNTPISNEEKEMKKTFTILHTNDMHSSFIGMGPAADYTPRSRSTTTRPEAGTRVWPV